VNAFTTSDQPELGSFLGGGVEKSREPNEWNTDASAVSKRDGQLVFRRFDVGRNWHHLNF
jgi:hypothetical protein